MIAAGGALLLLSAAFGHRRNRRALAFLELVVAVSVFVTPYPVAVLYAGFAGYLVVLRRRSPGAPCGCFAGEGPVTRWLVGRALFFAVGAALEPATPWLIALTGGFVLAMAGWLLPELTRVVRQPLRHTAPVEEVQ
ncbi:MauE/DoxX family redox-associated membrane protein [Actinosynnema sp. NPDC020468]|uniref:MauE/DoxX family redox-associated membrane protein n=1 Tax=Actinosynnema sp. NPDC020468 TaxID=3154488 RepID=UPI00340536A1